MTGKVLFFLFETKDFGRADNLLLRADWKVGIHYTISFCAIDIRFEKVCSVRQRRRPCPRDCRYRCHIEGIPASGPDPRGWAQRGINKNQGVIAIGRHLSLMTIRFFDLIKRR